MDRKSRTVFRALALLLAVAVVGSVASCGGGGGDPIVRPSPPPPPPPPPPTSTLYGAGAFSTNDLCGAVGLIGTGFGSAAAAQSALRPLCGTSARNLASEMSATPNPCSVFAFVDCAAIVAGRNVDTGRCVSVGRSRSTTSAARAFATQECRNILGASARCEVIAASCATGSAPPVGIFRPTTTIQQPSHGIPQNQVGSEFGRTSTTGRSFTLSCSNDVVFSDSGTVVLPSVDVVNLPAEAGTVTFEYDAIDIPDRFVVEMGGSVRVDTRYVGTTRTVSEINAVLAHYGFQQTTQSSIISPGSGSRSFQKGTGSTSAIVRIYAPLTGTAWNVRLRFQSATCPGSGTTTPPPPPQGAPEIVFETNDACNDGRDVSMRFSYYQGSQFINWATRPRVAGGSNTVTRVDCNFSNVDRVCYGARLDLGGGQHWVWGHDIDRSRGCTNCCYSCPTSGTVTRVLNFGCPTS